MPRINERVFGFLEGEWCVERRFEGSYGGAFTGRANFSPEAGGPSTCRYTEQGGLTDSEGKTFDARQSYRYRLVEGKLQVLKRDGADWTVMHELEFSGDAGQASASHVHLCGQDRYAATYRIDFAGEAWELAYAVSGPEKDYRIRSFYERPWTRY